VLAKDGDRLQPRGADCGQDPRHREVPLPMAVWLDPLADALEGRFEDAIWADLLGEAAPDEAAPRSLPPPPTARNLRKPLSETAAGDREVHRPERHGRANEAADRQPVREEGEEEALTSHGFHGWPSGAPGNGVRLPPWPTAPTGSVHRAPARLTESQRMDGPAPRFPVLRPAVPVGSETLLRPPRSPTSSGPGHGLAWRPPADWAPEPQPRAPADQRPRSCDLAPSLCQGRSRLARRLTGR
jgi:hypothetical protein